MKKNDIARLEERLNAIKEDTREKVDIINELGWETWIFDRKKAQELANLGSAMAEKLNYEKGMMRALLNLGALHFPNEVEIALPHLSKVLSWCKANNDLWGEAHAQAIIGPIVWGFGDFDRGLASVNRALQIYQALQDPKWEGMAYTFLGGFYSDLKEYKKSLESYRQGFERLKNIDYPLGVSRSLNGIGNAYHFMGDYEKALDYLQQALEMYREMKYKRGESRSLNSIGRTYQKLEQYDEALAYFQQSLAIREALSYSAAAATTLLDLGELFCHTGKLDKALEMNEKALALSQDIKAWPKVAQAQAALASIYEQSGDFEKALHHHKEFHQVESTVFRESADQKLKNMQTVYQLEASQKEAEIYRLRNVELKETLAKLNATQAQIVQSGKMVALGNLAAGIAHEINTPIGAIKSGNDISNRIADKLFGVLESFDPPEGIEKKLHKSIKILQQNSENNAAAANRIIKIIDSLKNFTRLDEAPFQKADLHTGIDSTLTLISHEIPEAIAVRKEYGDIPEIYVFSNEMNQVFMNLLLNAIQATPGEGIISIRTHRVDGNVCIQFSDSGKGIPAEKLATLFEPGFNRDHARVKMTTGLYTSLNIINKHQGTIEVDSTVGKGSTFTIRIPENLHDLLPDAIADGKH